MPRQRAEAGAPDGAAAAEDRHAADHHRGDHVELVAGAGGRVDRAEPGREQHPGQPGERAAEQERAQQVAGHPDAGQLGGLRARWRVVARTRPQEQWRIERELRVRIKVALDEAGIALPAV